jgi:MFS transporter, DHA2 family, multidrug resistance protein
MSGPAAPSPPTAIPSQAAAIPSPPTAIPWMGLLAVLLGTFISTLNTRLSTFGLADVRGAVHAGFDEGAWITTALTTGQMFIAPVAIWAGGVFGARRTLIAATSALAIIAAIEPFATNLQTLLTLQFASGLATGFFVPLTLSFVLRNTPPRAWAYGIALYALNLEVSLNVSASLEGWYLDHFSWAWIYWQNVPLAVAMMLCLRFGVRPEPDNPNPPGKDIYGLLSGGIGLALIYAALDQGNRLDWSNSGLVWGLMLSGVLLMVAFLIHESHTPHPGVDLKVVFTTPMPRILLLIAFLRLTILSTSYAVPQFLQVVRGFRTLEVGQTLVWIAVPQLLVCFAAGYLLRRSDPRLVASGGFVCICVACLMVAYGLTPFWGTDQFLPSQLLQAVGQSFALSGTIFFAVLHLKPQDALTFGAATQVTRLMGGEVGQAFITTFIRVREQVASNLLGLHVQIGDAQTIHRLQLYAAATAPAGDPSSAPARGAAVLGSVVHSAATTQGIIDGFIVIAALTALTLILMVTRRAAPVGPASHVSPFAGRDAS